MVKKLNKKIIQFFCLIFTLFTSINIFPSNVNALTQSGGQRNLKAYDNNLNQVADCEVYTSSSCSFQAWSFFFLDNQYYGTYNGINDGDTFVVTIPFYGNSSFGINGITSTSSNYAVDDVSYFSRDILKSNTVTEGAYDTQNTIVMPGGVCGYDNPNTACNGIYYQTVYRGIIDFEITDDFSTLIVVTGHFVGDQNLGTNPTLRFYVAANPSTGYGYNWKIGGGLLSVTDAYTPNYPKLNEIIDAIHAIGGLSKDDVQEAVGDSLNDYTEEQTAQAEEKGQESQDNSDESQEQVNNKTQNLFSFITSFFGAFTSASPSNCNFDWGLADKGFGVIDMCQTNIPTELQSVLSIVSILIVVPMVLWLINSIVGAFKEFQQ